MRRPNDLVPVTHPGIILKEEFLEPLGIKPAQLAKALGLTRARISEVCRGKRDITAETALLLGRFFDTTARFWVNLQAHYDLEIERERVENKKNKDPILIIKQNSAGDFYSSVLDPETGKTIKRSKYNPEQGLNVDSLLEAI